MTHLTYEAYVPLALKTLAALFAEARALPPPEPFSHAAPHACCARSGPHSHPAADHPDADAAPPRIELGRMHVAHLVGASPPRTPSIVVAVSSPHRDRCRERDHRGHEAATNVGYLTRVLLAWYLWLTRTRAPCPPERSSK